MKSDSKFAIYDGHSSFRGEVHVEYLGEMIIVKVFETTAYRRYLITFPDAGILAEFSGKASLLKVCESKITLLIAQHVFRSFIVVDVLST